MLLEEFGVMKTWWTAYLCINTYVGNNIDERSVAEGGYNFEKA